MRITPGENIKVAISSVWSHRFRSLLTVLGIVIGIKHFPNSHRLVFSFDLNSINNS